MVDIVRPEPEELPPMQCPRRAEAPHISEQYPRDSDWNTDGTCMYCGSMSPDQFFQAVENGECLAPTDKNYKVYVGSAHKKFYFQHFSQAERDRFIELYNAGKMVLTYPGHFYVTPFFCTHTPPSEE